MKVPDNEFSEHCTGDMKDDLGYLDVSDVNRARFEHDLDMLLAQFLHGMDSNELVEMVLLRSKILELFLQYKC